MSCLLAFRIKLPSNTAGIKYLRSLMVGATLRSLRTLEIELRSHHPLTEWADGVVYFEPFADASPETGRQVLSDETAQQLQELRVEFHSSATSITFIVPNSKATFEKLFGPASREPVLRVNPGKNVDSIQLNG
jgi:hypothetical protein